MSDRAFRLVFGSALLFALYMDFHQFILVLIGLLLFEGLTNWRLTMLVSRFYPPEPYTSDLPISLPASTINFDGERAMRLIVAGMLVIPIVVLNKYVLFVPWFVGFAFIGAGLSGICPMVLALKWSGFK